MLRGFAVLLIQRHQFGQRSCPEWTSLLSCHASGINLTKATREQGSREAIDNKVMIKLDNPGLGDVEKNNDITTQRLIHHGAHRLGTFGA